MDKKSVQMLTGQFVPIAVLTVVYYLIDKFNLPFGVSLSLFLLIWLVPSLYFSYKNLSQDQKEKLFFRYFSVLVMALTIFLLFSYDYFIEKLEYKIYYLIALVIFPMIVAMKLEKRP